MSSAKRLAREILDTRRLALGHATSPQLTSSALDGGQLDITDGDGNRVGGLGLGDDGGFVIDYTGGPKPPKPSPPTVTADAGIFRIEWDGSFVNEGDEGILATSDTDRVEIHASMDDNFVPDRVESFGGAFATLDGGSFTLGPLPEAGTYYFCLVARSKSAQFSEPSERVEQTLAITSIDLEVIDAWLTGEAAQTTADGKNSIWRGPEEPEVDPDRPFKDGDIWFEMVDGKSIPNIWDEATGSWVGNDDYRQSEIERVQQELRDELDTVITDGSGTKNFYKPVAPKSTDTPAPKEGDLWFDTSEAGANTVHVWTDGSWLSLADARVQEIAQAQEDLTSDLQDVQTSVDGKNTITYDPALPPASYVGAVGDTWYRTSGNSMIGFWKWDGAAWIQQELSTTVIPQIDIGAGTFGSLEGSRLIAGSVSTDMLAVGVAGGLIYDSKFTDAEVSAVRTAGTTWVWTTHGGETCFERVMPASLSMGQMQLKDPVGSTRYIPVSPGVKQVLELDVEGGISTFIGILYADGSTLTPGDSIQERWSTGRRIERYVIDPDLYPSPTSDTATHISLYLRQRNRGSSNTAGAVTRVFSARLSPMVGSTIIENGAVTTEKILAGAITAESGIIGSINAGTITVGEMDGARIKAQSIAADKVLIGNGAELMPDEYGLSDKPWYANFDGGSGTGWSAEAAYPGQARGVVLTHKPTGTSNMSLYANTLLSDHQIPVQPGETYQVFTWVYATGPVSGFSSGVAMQVYGYSNGSYKTNTRAGTALTTFPAGEWVKVGGVWTAPAGIDKFSPRLTVYYPSDAKTNSAKFYIGRVSVKSQVGATLIENGAITTEHIRTGAITAESGIIGSIDANVITVGKIMGNQLDADAINGKTITGAKIRTASSGSRVELTHNGLKQYNSLGATIVDMTAGSFALQGGSITGSTIKTATSGSRVEINTQGLKQYNSSNEVIAEMIAGSMVMRGVLEQTNSVARMQVGPAFDTSTSPGVRWENISGTTDWAGIGTVTSSGIPALTVQGPGRGSAGSLLVMMREYARLLARDSSGKSRSWLTLNENNGSYFTWAHPTNSGYSTVQLADRSAYVSSVDSADSVVGSLYISTSGTTLHAGSRNLSLEGARVQSARIYNTNTSAAPVYINTTGSLGKGGSSSIRYKQDISAGRVLNSILDIEPAQWRYKSEIEAFNEAEAYRSKIGEGPLPLSMSESPDEPGYHYGAIAEQVAELDLPELIRLDEYGRPDGLRYELFGMALIPIVRSLRDRIESLEAQLDASKAA